MKKFIPVLLLLIVFAVAVSGCQNGENPPAGAGSSTDTCAPSELTGDTQPRDSSAVDTQLEDSVATEDTAQSSDAPHEHTLVSMEAKEPTCTENGYTQGWFCKDCGEIITPSEVILASHKNEEILPVAPEKGKSGYTRGEKCSACGVVFVTPEEISLLTMEIDANASSEGVINVTFGFEGLEGEFTLKLADENKNALDYFTSVFVKNVTAEDYKETVSRLIVPSGCKYFIATDENEYVYFVKIPEEYLLTQTQYSFGALSDVHMNKGDYLTAALNFLDKVGVDFVGISGDLSSSGEITSFNKFNQAIKDRGYKVYTSSGNHDAAGVKNGNWIEYINLGITEDDEVVIIAENGIDFVYVPKKAENNVFVFLCQTEWIYPASPGDTILEGSQLDWLEQVLEAYKDRRVFLFFHTFLAGADGNTETAVGNLKNPGGYTYPLCFAQGEADEVRFRELMKKYKNVIFLSGHSHWMFELEIYNENLNVSNFDGEYGYMVHIPSVCEPRWIGEDDTSRTSKTGKASEGWIIEITEGGVVLIPVDFIKGVYYTEYMELIP